MSIYEKSLMHLASKCLHGQIQNIFPLFFISTSLVYVRTLWVCDWLLTSLFFNVSSKCHCKTCHSQALWPSNSCTARIALASDSIPNSIQVHAGIQASTSCMHACILQFAEKPSNYLTLQRQLEIEANNTNCAKKKMPLHVLLSLAPKKFLSYFLT